MRLRRHPRGGGQGPPLHSVRADDWTAVLGQGRIRVVGMVSQRVNAERVMLLAWPRAILLQVAHPLVAAGVAEHSSFADGGFTAVHRLWQTGRIGEGRGGEG